MMHFYRAKQRSSVYTKNGEFLHLQGIKYVEVLASCKSVVLQYLTSESQSKLPRKNRFHHLFEKSTREHGGVVAMGLLAPPAGILQTLPLCEIESYQTMQGETGFGTDFSILVTIRAVGRGSLVSIQEDDEETQFLTGWCTELCDDASSEYGKTEGGRDILQLGNDLADKMEGVFNAIIILENELEQIEDDFDEMSLEPSEATLKRMQLELELELDDNDNVDDDEEDDEDEDDDEDLVDSFRSRFQKAYEIAKASDMQGYRVTSTSSETGKKMRSVQELTALSWAYFSLDLWNPDILTFRLRAVESSELCERLKLALVMMMEYRSKLRETLKSRDSNDEQL